MQRTGKNALERKFSYAKLRELGARGRSTQARIRAEKSKDAYNERNPY